MQAPYLEETIRSVLLQGYPNLEYIILDGGSTDGSSELIRKYEPWLAGWRCAKDGGQADAINEGWRQARGEIVAWINSDDWYQPGALFAAARKFMEEPDAMWVSGRVDDCAQDGAFVKSHDAAACSLAECLGRKAPGLHQPGMFWRRSLLERIGYLDDRLHYGFDHEFWVRTLLCGASLVPLDFPVACFRRHSASKSMSQHERFLEEDWQVFRRHAPSLPPAERTRAGRWLREYEADLLLDNVYRSLAMGRRWEAARQLLSRPAILPLLKPGSLALGAFWRVFVTGRSAEWFTERDQASSAERTKS